MEKLRYVIFTIISIISLILIFIGYKFIGPIGLGIMLIGVAGLLITLYLYNKKYR